MSQPARLVTAEELEKFPDDDYRYELVEGRVIRMSPVGFQHGHTVMAFGLLLGPHVKAGRLGVVGPEIGFKLASNPDTVLAPDLAFVRQERIASPPPKGFWNGPPDLAVEVLSPEDRPSEVQAKVEEYLTHGVTVVLVLDPDEKSASVYRRLTAPVTLRADDALDLGDVVRGFSCSVREIFE